MLLAHDLLIYTIYSVIILLNLLLLYFSPAQTFIRRKRSIKSPGWM